MVHITAPADLQRLFEALAGSHTRSRQEQRRVMTIGWLVVVAGGLIALAFWSAPQTPARWIDISIGCGVGSGSLVLWGYCYAASQIRYRIDAYRIQSGAPFGLYTWSLSVLSITEIRYVRGVDGIRSLTFVTSTSERRTIALLTSIQAALIRMEADRTTAAG